MPDENPSLAADALEIPGLETVPAAPAVTPTPPVEDSLAKRVLTAAGGVFERHGVKFRPGRGRPRADGAPKASDVPLEAAPAPVAAAPAQTAASFRSPSDAGFVKSCCRAAIKGIFSAIDKLIGKKAVEAGYSNSDVEKIVRENSITPEETDGFADLAVVLADYFKIDTKTVAMGGAVVLVGGVAGRYSMTFADLAKMATAKAKADKNGSGK